MRPNTSQAPRKDLPSLMDESAPDSEVTGIRARRPKVQSILDAEYPPRPERTRDLSEIPIERLEYELELRIDQWAEQKMLKTQIIPASDKERQDMTKRMLEECQKKGKIFDFEPAETENGRQAYMIYYRYKHS